MWLKMATNKNPIWYEHPHVWPNTFNDCIDAGWVRWFNFVGLADTWRPEHVYASVHALGGAKIQKDHFKAIISSDKLLSSMRIQLPNFEWDTETKFDHAGWIVASMLKNLMRGQNLDATSKTQIQELPNWMKHMAMMYGASRLFGTIGQVVLTQEWAAQRNLDKTVGPIDRFFGARGIYYINMTDFVDKTVVYTRTKHTQNQKTITQGLS